jgi:hypothetical protein
MLIKSVFYEYLYFALDFRWFETFIILVIKLTYQQSTEHKLLTIILRMV